MTSRIDPEVVAQALGAEEVRVLRDLPLNTRLRNVEITQRIVDICRFWTDEKLRAAYASTYGATEHRAFYGKDAEEGLRNIETLARQQRLEK